MKNIRINYLDPQSKQKIQRILQLLKLIYETEGYAAHNATHYLIWTNYNPEAAYNIIQNNGGHFQNKPKSKYTNVATEVYLKAKLSELHLYRD